MPTVSSFFGLKLRTGALLIGYFEVVISFICVVLCSLLIAFIDDDNKALFRNVSMIGISVSVLTFIVGLFLTSGINKSDRTQIQPWIVIKGIMLCFEFGVILLTCWILYLEYSSDDDVLIYLVALPLEICVTGECDDLDESDRCEKQTNFRSNLLYDDCGAIALQNHAELQIGCLNSYFVGSFQ